MKQTLNRLTTPSPSDSDSGSDSGSDSDSDNDNDIDNDNDSESESESESSSQPRTLHDLNTVSSPFGSAAAGFPVDDSFRKLGPRPPSPMTRKKLLAILQEALDITNDDVSTFELDVGQGDEQ
jgi:hypothetical protein